jgi:hypothetical protein
MHPMLIQIFMSALLGLGLFQSAQVNLLYGPPIATPSSSGTSATGTSEEPPSPCIVDVQFFNQNGVQAGATQEFDLTAGGAAAASLSRGKLNEFGLHQLFYATVSVKDTCEGTLGCSAALCPIVISLEAVDGLTGNTDTFIQQKPGATAPATFPGTPLSGSD